ncbi:hypothetical protein GCK72_022406 [Caenorhabditis remanei]|uniref:Uncharacterized protein n=1 Tax=Caenorhabditis remanei TaxID=31234 RepID=A0A6A5FTN5_CAERE|nr:hypothetical protein GCK72_022406 [Caenorhabditis remanei]KAF1745958.1 hypothetical protein GCK72_022406 [Caenorhabditis remanei]
MTINDEVLRNFTAKGKRQKLPSNKELAKVTGAKNKEEDDEDMEIPEDGDEEKGPSEPQESQRQLVIDDDGWTTISKRQ